MTSVFTVDMNEYLPLRDVVFNTLRQAILKGELKSGERLMEMELAQRLGVSRTPIREAMRKLELEGLVVMIPRKGAHVAGITEKDLSDVLEVRITLESMAVEKACRNMDEEQIGRLNLASRNFAHTIQEGDVTKLAEADEAFHEVIYQASGNAKLIQVLANMREQMYRYRLEYLKDEEAREQLLAEHQELVSAIRERDERKAKEITFSHLENQRQAILRTIRKEQQDIGRQNGKEQQENGLQNGNAQQNTGR
ncbi:MAG: GntR family transcriptional regulator [Blautia sp.]|nr:GntR family transcriptional regulator [Blautia sp.]